MKKYNKSERKELRKLSELAYKRELNSAINDLYNKFKEWEKGSIDSFKLDHEIHKYHNGISRELYKKYDDNDLIDITIGWAIAKGILEKSEVSDNLINKLHLIIERYN